MGWQPILQAFDEHAEVEVYERNLPHWRQSGATYFVTWRLADALPRAKLAEIKQARAQWRKLADQTAMTASVRQQAYSEWFSERIEKLLAAGYGDCLLGNDVAGRIVEQALLHFQGSRYAVDSYVVMPNHLHVLVTPQAGHDLSSIVHSWKSYIAHRLNLALQRSGTVWQDEYFDHIVRDEVELDGYREYIARNPSVANLSHGSYRVGGPGLVTRVGCTGETPVPREVNS